MTNEITILSDYDAHEMYDEMLDECYPMVSICGYDHYPSECLKEMDPIAYRCGFSDWVASEEENNVLVEGYYCAEDLERMKEKLGLEEDDSESADE